MHIWNLSSCVYVYAPSTRIVTTIFTIVSFLNTYSLLVCKREKAIMAIGRELEQPMNDQKQWTKI